MKKKVLKSTLYLFLALGLTAFVLFYKTHSLLNIPMITGKEAVIIEVKPNSTAMALIQTLYSKNLIPSKRLLLQYIKMKGLAARLQTGIYQVLPGESAQQLIDRIVAGDVLSQNFRIIEGSNLTQVSNNLKQAPFLNYCSCEWTAIAGPHLNAEGLLLADTYHYLAGSKAENLLLTANKQLETYLEKSWQERDPSLPYKTSYELLTVASIIEKESALPAERTIISGVVVNRLLKHMPLQMDPTVIYALGTQFSGKLSHEDLSIDSPYNTYRYRGLPPTPIAMVGKSAIDAAAHPQKSNYLYFVAKGDGTHIFSETYTEQKKAIFKHQ